MRSRVDGDEEVAPRGAAEDSINPSTSSTSLATTPPHKENKTKTMSTLNSTYYCTSKLEKESHVMDAKWGVEVTLMCGGGEEGGGGSL